MLLSSSILAYENKLKCLIRCDGTIPQVIALLKKVITHSRNKQTLRYLRLWLYLAAFSKHPLTIYQHLLDNHIGSTHALLYQDVCYHYSVLNREDKAQAILRKGIELNAQPAVDLERSLWYLKNGRQLNTAPPSMTRNSSTALYQQPLPLFVAGLGSSGVSGILDAMELYIHKTARAALFSERERGTYSCEEIRERYLISKHTPAFDQSSRIALQQCHHRQHFVEPDRHIPPGKITLRRALPPIGKHSQKVIDEHHRYNLNINGKQQQRQLDHPQVPPLNLPRLSQGWDENLDQDNLLVWREDNPQNQKGKNKLKYDANQQPQDYKRPSIPTIGANQKPIVFYHPIRFDFKQTFVDSQVIEATTHDLLQTHEPNCLSALHRKQRGRRQKKEITLKLNQQKVRCLEYLGKGTYGLVYLIEWKGRLAAMKVQTTTDRWDHYMLQSIYQRCPAAHRFVVRSHALYLNRQSSFMIMDYLPQGTLWDCLSVFNENNINTMSEPLVQLLILRLLQCVVMLHSAHFIHMDIKLDNIMMDYSIANKSAPVTTSYLIKQQPPFSADDPYWNKVTIKLIDFGLAVNLDLLSADISSTAELQRRTVLAKEHEVGTKKNDMPAIASGSHWPPHHLDYWCVANAAHQLLFGDTIKYGRPNRPKRKWNMPFWTSFFKILIFSPALCLEGGIRDLMSLIADLELSLQNDAVKNEAAHQLYRYDYYYDKKK